MAEIAMSSSFDDGVLLGIVVVVVVGVGSLFIGRA